jgi:Tfp pilus assembly protein PilN
MSAKSFLEDDYLERRLQRRTNTISLTLFFIVMGAVVAAYLVTDRQRLEVKRLGQQVSRDFEEAAKRLEQLDQLHKRKQEMLRKAAVTGVLVERVPRSIVVAEMVNSMPVTVGLTEFEMTTKVVATGPRPKTAMDKAKQDKKKQEEREAAEEPVLPPTEVEIKLVGLAPTDVEVAQFMTGLGQCKLFKDVNLAFSEESALEGRVLRKFRVEMGLRNDVDMSQYEPTRVSRLPQNPMGDKFQITAQGQMTYPQAMPPAEQVRHIQRD